LLHTPEEYRALYTFGRKWIKQAKTSVSKWYRTVIYNFILIMTNTGMRPAEAKNLRWRDVAPGKDREGREFARISVRGYHAHARTDGGKHNRKHSERQACARTSATARANVGHSRMRLPPLYSGRAAGDTAHARWWCAPRGRCGRGVALHSAHGKR
jgi:hypothetical protein